MKIRNAIDTFFKAKTVALCLVKQSVHLQVVHILPWKLKVSSASHLKLGNSFVLSLLSSLFAFSSLIPALWQRKSGWRFLQKLGIELPYVLADHSWVNIQRLPSQYNTETFSHPWLLQHHPQYPSYGIGLGVCQQRNG